MPSQEIKLSRTRTVGSLAGHTAVVTGASSGIGRAVAVALARQGVELCVVGRNPTALEDAVAVIRPLSKVKAFQIDLTIDEDLHPLIDHLQKSSGLNVLIHCAGVIHQNLMERARIEDFDLQYATNVRAPYLLTQRLLPLLTAARGQIVFINSSAGLAAKRPEVSGYAATKHALRAIADSIREEVNPKGVRVLTVYLGRTATPMQKALCHQEGRAFRPELLLQPDDVAAMVVHALMLPASAEVTDISMRPMCKSS